MAPIELSIIDIILVVAVGILVMLYVTILLRLRPSQETAIKEDVRVKPVTPTVTPSKPPTLETIEKQRAPMEPSQRITIAEALKMRQTSSATVEPPKPSKPPIVYIENNRVEEEEREVPRPIEEGEREVPKPIEEEQPPQPTPPPPQPPVQIPTAPPTNLVPTPPKGSASCSHYFGYLKALSRDTPIPDECFGCTRIMECFMQE